MIRGANIFEKGKKMKEKLELEVVLRTKADIQDAAGLSKEDKETLKFVARELAWKMDTCPGCLGATVKELENELRRINALPTIGQTS